MLPEDYDTIAAISTGSGIAAIGLVRLSGPEALSVADRVFVGSTSPTEMQHSTLQFGRIVSNGIALDEVILSVMRAPKSYTGEDVVEISCHGNPLILRDVLDAVIAAGARLASGGEFTRRAFLHGKMDLCQAEAVIELLSAETEEAKRVALSQVQGSTSETIGRLRSRVIGVKAALDASIDFPDDVADVAQMDYDGCSDDTPASLGSFVAMLSEASEELDAMIAAFAESQRLRKAPSVAIIGKTNVGKSTLLNALLGEERVITSDRPGTTRDRVDADLRLPSGRIVRMSDTAGPVVQEDELDSKARAKMVDAARNSDVLLMVLDVSTPLDEKDRALVDQWSSRPVIWVFNKADLDECWEESQLKALTHGQLTQPVLRTCATSGSGIDGLKRALEERLDDLLPRERTDVCVVGTVRNKNLLVKARDALRRAESGLRSDAWPEFLSRDLDESLDALGEILGLEADVDILDEIFSRFCIGK